MKTIEQKAKAYDEIIERAKTMLSAGEVMYGKENNASQLITDLIPELRESEDERIRKALIDFFGEQCDMSDVNGVYAYEVVAWLEKQKEQKPAEKQDYSGLNDFERAIHRGFLCAGVENVPVTIIKETAQDCLAHLPAEWTEEDKANLDNIIWLCENCEKGIENVWIPSQATQIKNLIKSLRPSWKPTQEQMEALEDAKDDYQSDGKRTGNTLYKQIGATLESLYNDLLKQK